MNVGSSYVFKPDCTFGNDPYMYQLVEIDGDIVTFNRIYKGTDTLAGQRSYYLSYAERNLCEVRDVVHE